MVQSSLEQSNLNVGFEWMDGWISLNRLTTRSPYRLTTRSPYLTLRWEKLITYTWKPTLCRAEIKGGMWCRSFFSCCLQVFTFYCSQVFIFLLLPTLMAPLRYINRKNIWNIWNRRSINLPFFDPCIFRQKEREWFICGGCISQIKHWIPPNFWNNITWYNIT